MQEVDNVLRILKEAQEALLAGDSYKLKKLSDQTIHTATITQDPDNVVVSVLIYSLAKITEREHYKTMGGWGLFYKTLTSNLKLAIQDLQKNNLDSFRQRVGVIRNSINKISSNLSDYIRDVFYKAGINKAFKIYEHGLSAEKTASLLGVSLWDLSSYIGQTSISEAAATDSMPVKKRIKIVEEFFR